MTVTDIESRVAALEEELAALREEVKELERAQIAAAMRRSKEQFDRGEGIPAVEAAQRLARKYGIIPS